MRKSKEEKSFDAKKKKEKKLLSFAPSLSRFLSAAAPSSVGRSSSRMHNSLERRIRSLSRTSNEMKKNAILAAAADENSR